MVVVPECSWCGKTEDDDILGRSLIVIRVTIADGQEGFADVIQQVCDDHLIMMQRLLPALGFVDHRHGGMNFLEDELCPGALDMDKCPTPTEYGTVLVTPRGPVQLP